MEYGRLIFRVLRAINLKKLHRFYLLSECISCKVLAFTSYYLESRFIGYFNIILKPIILNHDP